MNEHRLEELKELSKPALRHVELVEMARTLSPNQVGKQVGAAGWPSRQAKAARSLCVLKRDFGPGVFEAFITTMERARSEQSDTEQAQEDKRMKARLKKSLQRISDPRKKLEVMVSGGLFKDATAFIKKLLREMDVNLVSHESVTDGQGRPKLFSTSEENASPVGTVNVAFAPKECAQPGCEPESRAVVLVVSLEGLIQALQWSDEQVLSFVEALIKKVLKVSHDSRYAYMITSTLQKLVRHFLDPASALANKAERWMLLALLFEGRLFELRKTALPVPVDRRNRGGPKSNYEIRAELDPVVERMLELGMSKQEVKEVFLNWMREKGEHCRWQFMLAMAGAECFENPSYKVSDVLREVYLPSMWEKLVKYDHVRSFMAFKPLGLWKVARPHESTYYYVDTDQQFFREGFAKLLSRGKAAKVFQLLVLVGSDLGVYPCGLNSKRFSPYNCKNENARAMMSWLATDAFELAFAAEDYGIAAGLADYFDCADDDRFIEQAVDLCREQATEIWRFPENVSAEYVRRTLFEDKGDPKKEPESTRVTQFKAEVHAIAQELKQKREEKIREARTLSTDLRLSRNLNWMEYADTRED